MSVRSDNEFQGDFSVFVACGLFNVFHDFILVSFQIQFGQTSGIVGIFAAVHHREFAVALQQYRVRRTGIQKMYFVDRHTLIRSGVQGRFGVASYGINYAV